MYFTWIVLLSTITFPWPKAAWQFRLNLSDENITGKIFEGEMLREYLPIPNNSHSNSQKKSFLILKFHRYK